MKNNQDYTPSIPGKKHEIENTQLECKENLNPDSHMMLSQKFIEELPDAISVIMTQLYLKAGIKHWRGKGQVAFKYEMKHMEFRGNFNPKHYKDLN